MAIALVVVHTFVDLIGIAISNDKILSSKITKLFAGGNTDEENIKPVTKFLNN